MTRVALLRISCILNSRQIEAPSPDLVAFPEGIDWPEIEKACARCPDAMIVGAVVEERRSRGVLWHRGQNRIEYVKVGTDGRTTGSGNVDQNPVYECGNACIGVLICMDLEVNFGAFPRTVVERVKASRSPLKIVCIPADMGGHWFHGPILSSRQFDGLHVVLCNHTKTHQSRCKSFITDTAGAKIAMQDSDEPIHAELPVK